MPQYTFTIPEIPAGSYLPEHAGDGLVCIRALFGFDCRLRHGVIYRRATHAAHLYVRGRRLWPGTLVTVDTEDDEMLTLDGFRRALEDIRISFVCGHCSYNIQYASVVETVDGNEGCTLCIQECHSCGNAHYTNTMVYIDGDFYCSDCPQLCFECGGRLGEVNYRRYNGKHYCSLCVAYCADCGDSYFVSDGPECNCSDLVQIEGYNHTTPSMWLGGPLPRNHKGKLDGYYLGIELEVTAHDTDFSNTVEWCESYIGAGALHIKEDCSVEGYELVFEPMTPQFFEAVNWRGFFLALDRDQYVRGDTEPEEHGLHVHVGRVAFRGRTSRLAAFSGIMGATGPDGTHMERVGRRDATSYCEVVPNPIQSAIVSKDTYSAQSVRIQRKGAPISPYGRNAINFNRSDTVEIRSPKSTRDADEFMETVRTVYLAADYVRSMEFLSPAAISWEAFTLWIQENHADKLGENMLYEFDEDEEV